jgi:hypothetical protein
VPAEPTTPADSSGASSAPPARAAPARKAAVKPAAVKKPAAKKPAPVIPVVEVSARGAVVTSTLNGTARDKYRLVPTEKGTVVISVDRIQGLQARALLRNAEGLVVRRADKRGKIWARPQPGDELTLEIWPPEKDASITYILSVSFDIDRPREQRGQQRPLRPRDIIKLAAPGLSELDQVIVDGIHAESSINKTNLLVTIPAFARAGPIELRYETRPPQTYPIEIIGAEPPRADIVTDACNAPGGGAQPGCLALVIGPNVGSQWLAAIARVLDADVTKHIVKTGAVELKLRMPASETYALDLLAQMPGIVSAKAGRVP